VSFELQGTGSKDQGVVMKKISYRKAADEPAGAYWTKWREEICAVFGTPKNVKKVSIGPIGSRPVDSKVMTFQRTFLNKRQFDEENSHAAA